MVDYPRLPQDYGEYMTNEVPDSQALLDYSPRTISDEIQFSETPLKVSVSLTAEQYLKIMSSLFTGAWWVYPDEWLEVMASFWQGIVIDMINDCDDIADCIDSSESVKVALDNWNANNGGGSGAGTPDTVSTLANDNNLLPIGYTCDNDHLFGMCMEIVGMINANTTEVFQAIDADFGNALDLINSILDNIPIVELLGIVTEFITWVADDISTEYQAAWSLTVQQEIACQLFCIIKDSCSLSWDNVWDLYVDISNIGVPITDDANGWYETLIDTVLGTDKQTVALGSFAGLIAMRYGGQFAYWVAGIRTLKQTIELAQDATDPDWDILCTDCTDLCYIWDFTIDNRGWQVWSTGSRPFGVYVAATGWQCTYNNVSGAGNDNRIYIENLAWVSSVAVVKIELDVIPTSGNSNRSIGGRTMSGTTVVEDHEMSPQTTINSTLQTVQADYASSGNGLRIYATTDTSGGADQDALTIVAIRVFYTSGTPEGGAAC